LIQINVVSQAKPRSAFAFRTLVIQMKYVVSFAMRMLSSAHAVFIVRDARECVELSLFAIRCIARGSAAHVSAGKRIKPSVR
jgi:hypothetical protein